LFEKPVSNWIGSKSLSFKIILSFLISLVIIGVGLLVNALAGNWQVPTVWVNQALAAGAAAPDPYNLEGTFTIAGVWFGFTAGYAWLLHKKGKVEVKGPISKRIYRYLVGLVGVAVLYVGLKLIFPVSPEWLGFSLRFVRYALLGLWISALAPMLFKKLHLDA